MKSFYEYLEEVSSTETSLKNKSKQSGISVSILQDVFDRGVGAYKTNFGSVRPWVKKLSPEAGKKVWGMARVNAFAFNKKSKSRNKADADLWEKHTNKK
jgi:hypothetical protein